MNVIKKRTDGWVVKDPTTRMTYFLSNEQLEKLGVLVKSKQTLTPPKDAPKVIIVPSHRPRYSFVEWNSTDNSGYTFDGGSSSDESSDDSVP